MPKASLDYDLLAIFIAVAEAKSFSKAAIQELADALRKSEGELQQLLDFAPQLVSVVGPAGEHIHINRMAIAYLGITLDEWKKVSAADEVHPDDLERVVQANRCRTASGGNCRRPG